MSLGDEHITRAARVKSHPLYEPVAEALEAALGLGDQDSHIAAFIAVNQFVAAGAVGDVIPPRPPTDDEIWEAAEKEKWGGGEDWYPGFMAGFMAGFKAAALRGLVLPVPPETP